MRDFRRVKAVRQRVWLVAGALLFVGGLWKLTPIVTSHAQRADGYAYLTQALEILGDQNPEPDFCVEGGIADPEAKALVGQAIEALEEARASTPAEAQTWLLLGRGYCLFGKGEEAVEAYERYTVLRPGNPLGHLELGFAYEVLGEFHATKQEWQQAYLTIEKFLDAGNEEQAKGDNDQAQRWYEYTILLNPDYAKGWYLVGNMKEQQNNFLEAFEAYEKTIQLDPMMLPAYFGIARGYKYSGEIVLALETYQKITQIDKSAIEAYIEIGQIEDRLGNTENALVAYQTAALLGKFITGNQAENVWKRAWPNYLLGNIYLRLERYSEAKLSYENAIHTDPLNLYSEWALWGLGRIANYEKSYYNALDFLNQALELTPNYYLRSQVYLQISIAYQGQGDRELYIKYLSKAHLEDLDNKGMHLLYADGLIEIGDIQQGIREYKNYLIKWPNDISIVEKLTELEKLYNTQSQP